MNILGNLPLENLQHTTLQLDPHCPIPQKCRPVEKEECRTDYVEECKHEYVEECQHDYVEECAEAVENRLL